MAPSPTVRKHRRKECKNADTLMGIGVFGDPSEIRTPDPLLKRQLLCRLS